MLCCTCKTNIILYGNCKVKINCIQKNFCSRVAYGHKTKDGYNLFLSISLFFSFLPDLLFLIQSYLVVEKKGKMDIIQNHRETKYRKRGHALQKGACDMSSDSVLPNGQLPSGSSPWCCVS